MEINQVGLCKNKQTKTYLAKSEAFDYNLQLNVEKGRGYISAINSGGAINQISMDTELIGQDMVY